MNIVKDGRTIDTLDRYRWGYFVGGEYDDDPVPADAWDKKTLEYGPHKATYERKSWTSVGAPVRVVFFLAADWPKDLHWGYAVHRRVYSTHPDLEKLPDRVIDASKKKDHDADKA